MREEKCVMYRKDAEEENDAEEKRVKRSTWYEEKGVLKRKGYEGKARV